MIHEEEKQEILSSLTGEETSFAIDATSSHIFEILRDKQYSNGKESLVREIIANAKDSHAEAGKSDVPIRIWLNTNYLTIQDFGVGLSPERMDTVYRHYGRSSKRNSNEQQGFYGIGAKSFFSYATSASITSIYNGIKYEYVAYINDTGVGAIPLISQEPTDEGNGVSIKIPIQSRHFTEFRGYVQKYAQFMDPTPEILGDNIYGPTEPPKVTLEGTGWKMFARSDLSQYNVLLDGIPYKYDVDYDKRIHGVTFIFKTGQLIPSATREALTVCQKNEDAINAASKIFKAEIIETTKSAIENSNDLAEVISAIDSAKKFFGSTQEEWKWGGGTLTYPFHDNRIIRCTHGYGQLRKNSVVSFDSNDPKLNSIILVPEEFDFYGIKGYTTRKINHHRVKNGLSTVYLVRPSHGLPDSAVTKFEAIKISNPGASNVKPRIKNAPKTNIYVSLRGKTSRSLAPIDRKNMNEVIYTTGDINEFCSQYKSLGHINAAFVGVQGKDVKLIKGKPGWYTIQEFIEEKLTKSLTKEKIELEYKKAEANKAFEAYRYLKDYIHQDFQLAFEKTELTPEQLSLVKFIQENGELDEPELPDLYAKYPLLALVNKYEVDGVPGMDNYSWNIKIKFKSVIEYIQLINQQNDVIKENENV